MHKHWISAHSKVEDITIEMPKRVESFEKSLLKCLPFKNITE